MVEVINETAVGGQIVSASSSSTVLANFSKTISDAGDVTEHQYGGASECSRCGDGNAQAILGLLLGTFDDTNGASYATGNIAFDVVVQDGDGVDASGQINSFASGSVVKTTRENAVNFTEGTVVARRPKQAQMKSVCSARSTLMVVARRQRCLWRSQIIVLAIC